jgi:hypothetical protein
MNSLDINQMLLSDPESREQFRGVYALDELEVELFNSDIDEAQGIHIFNTDRSSEPGEHWIAVYIQGKRASYFDSFGRNPDIYPMLSTQLKKLCTSVL